jgi:hypothetical protein
MRVTYYRIGTMLMGKRAGIGIYSGRRYGVHLCRYPRWMLIGPTYAEAEANNRLVRLLKRRVEQ